MDWILAGLAFGFLGSFHCIGMCGPLALALPGSQGVDPSFVFSRLVYNLGRVITYTMLGVAVGLISQMISISGYQQWLSIAIGTLMLLGLTVSWFREKLDRWKAYPGKLIGKATKPIKRLFKNDSLGSLFLIGILNGILPCGFVYMALATAVTSGAVINSLFFMMGFGLGTIPAMLSTSLAGGLISISYRRKLQRFSPYFIAFIGILLICRGLNLGIPFLSPKLG